MTPEAAAWVVAAVAAAVIGVLVRAGATLFSRVRDLERGGCGVSELGSVKKELHDFELRMEREFIRRDQWVPTMSRIEGMLEGQGVLLARLEEREKAHEQQSH